MTIGVLFLAVAPSNVLSREHSATIRQWTQPEFQQRWQVFAPDVPRADVRMEVRVRVAGEAGASGRVSDWFGLSARAAAALRSDPIPARRLSAELVNAWSFYRSTHDTDGVSVGRRGALSEQYLRRLVLSRLDASEVGGVVEHVQLRMLFLPFTPPAWTGERVDPPSIRLLPWWPVDASDRAAGSDGALVIARP